MIRVSRFSNQINNFSKNYFENTAWNEGSVVCGIDEVGRGCLAGPLVTAAVILPKNCDYPLLKDSKTMTARQRTQAYDWITQNCAYSYGIVHHRVIDSHNIWNATLIAMKKALVGLLTQETTPSCILVDAMPLELLDTSYKDIPVHYFPYGEEQSSSIAAASIIAKVKRDKLMHDFDTLIPGYDFKAHKGYATAGHRTSMNVHQRSLIHRCSFVLSSEQTKHNTRSTDTQLDVFSLPENWQQLNRDII